MEKKRLTIALSLVLSLIITTAYAVSAWAADVPRITKEELKAELENPDVVILDVRRGKDWTDSDQKIKGAIREDGKEYESWAENYPKDKKIVLYCA
jgi:rhodanese-related sulfurtransferase